MGGSQSLPAVSATHTAPSNIALIKYWGKRDVALNTPINSSISLTLSDDLCATTTVVAHASFERDRLWLNGEEVDINARVRAVLRELRARARPRRERRRQWRGARARAQGRAARLARAHSVAQ